MPGNNGGNFVDKVSNENNENTSNFYDHPNNFFNVILFNVTPSLIS